MALPWQMPLETLPTVKKKGEPAFQPSLLKHFCNIGFYDPPTQDVQTGLMCDIGPFNQATSSIQTLIGAGMTVARVVFGDLSPEACTNLLKSIRQAVYNYSIENAQVCPLALLTDFRGPDILTGDLKSGAFVEIVTNTVLRLTTDTAWQDNGTSECLYFGYNHLTSLRQGDFIYIDSITEEKIKLLVMVVGIAAVDCNVLVGGLIGPNMIVHIVQSSKSHKEHQTECKTLEGDSENTALDDCESRASLVLEDDELKNSTQLITWAAASYIDGIILSNTKTVHCIIEVRNVAEKTGKSLMIFVCIDSFVAFANFDRLLHEADGIYLDRNVLSQCLPVENINLVTKIMMSKCNCIGKPCIVTAALNEELPFMFATDIANLVHDGVDIIALKFYYDTIDVKFKGHLDSLKVAEKCLAAVTVTCKYAEKTIWKPRIYAAPESMLYSVDDTTKALCTSALELAMRSQATAIICLTNSGKAPKLLAQVKSLCPIVAVTRLCSTARQLQFWRGIKVLHYFEEMKSTLSEELDARILAGLDYCKAKRIIQAGDPYVVVLWTRPGIGHCNFARLLYASARATVAQC